MPFADVNGQTIHYLDTGGDGPAILLSHGFGMGHEMWVHQVGPLTGAGWRVVTYDERGWGQTTHTEPFDYWDLAGDVLGLMDHLGIDKFFFMGLCIGGPFALKLMERAPGRIVAGILCQPVGSNPAFPDSMYDSGQNIWAPELMAQRPEIAKETIAPLCSYFHKADLFSTSSNNNSS